MGDYLMTVVIVIPIMPIPVMMVAIPIAMVAIPAPTPVVPGAISHITIPPPIPTPTPIVPRAILGMSQIWHPHDERERE